MDRDDRIRIIRLAAAAAQWYTQRDDGRFFTTDGAPDWIRDLTHAAHDDGTPGGMLPDDYRYRWTSAILDDLAELDPDDRHALDDFDGPEHDVYTADLTHWLASHNGRLGYIDQALEDTGPWHSGAFELLATAQALEIGETRDAILAYLTARADDLAYTDDDPIEDCRPSADDDGTANADL